jgi:uncharacterized membrane protein
VEKSVIGVFTSRDDAEQAVQELRSRGFRQNEISIIARDESGRESGSGGIDTTMGTGEQLGTGVSWGGAIGGLAGLLAGAGALAIPGIGPIVAAGPIAGVLSGAVTGGVAGGLLDWGIPEERGREYEQRLRSGGIIALVKADERRVSQAADIFRGNGARDVETHDVRR